VSNNRRKGESTFFRFPHEVLRSPNYVSLSHIARSLLTELVLQFSGANNGDLDTTWTRLALRGWNSKTTVAKHVDELIYYGFIVRVQDGGINVGGKKRPNLYALTWIKVDKVGYSDGYAGGSDWKVGQTPHGWRTQKPPYYKPKKKRKSPSELRGNKKLNATSCTHRPHLVYS